MAKFTLDVENGIIQKTNVSVKDSLTYRTRPFCYSDRLVNPSSRFLELVQNNPIKLFERRRILSGMTSGPIYSKDIKIPKEKTKKRRARRKALPEPLPRLDGSDDSGINENCDVIHIEDEFHFGNSVFIRCPVIECDFKHLTHDKNDNSKILAHMKQNHLGKFSSCCTVNCRKSRPVLPVKP